MVFPSAINTSSGFLHRRSECICLQYAFTGVPVGIRRITTRRARTGDTGESRQSLSEGEGEGEGEWSPDSEAVPDEGVSGTLETWDRPGLTCALDALAPPVLASGVPGERLDPRLLKRRYGMNLSTGPVGVNPPLDAVADQMPIRRYLPRSTPPIREHPMALRVERRATATATSARPPTGSDR
jgi:hypothetical protein